MTASFGIPAPLPGQPGFGSKTSEVMARETADMEERLAQLKNELSFEADLREATGPKPGCARWRSARMDRGSVRAYAKDVKHRHQQQMQKQSAGHATPMSDGVATNGKPQAGTGARAAAALREEQQYLRRHLEVKRREGEINSQALATEISGGFATKRVSRWSVTDTLHWLDSIGLGRYRGPFQANEVSGEVLLEIGLDDLDYMKVRVLAHRKRLVKAIEELQRRDGESADVPPPVPAALADADSCGTTESQFHCSKVTEFPTMEGVGHPQPSTGQTNGVHGSQPKASSNSRHVVNSTQIASTDIANVEYDAKATRCNHSNTASEPYTQQHIEASACVKDTWYGRAPVGGHLLRETSMRGGQRFETHPSRGKVRVGMLGVTSPTECWANPFAEPKSDPSNRNDPEDVSTALRRGPKPTVTKEKGLAGGDLPTLDEDAEHEAFQRAVAEWNRSKSNAASNQINDGDNDRCNSQTPRVSSSKDTESVTAAAAARRRVTEERVEALRRQMDSDHREQSKRLEETRKELLQGLEVEHRDRDTRATALEPGLRGKGDSDGGERPSPPAGEQGNSHDAGPPSLCSSTSVDSTPRSDSVLGEHCMSKEVCDGSVVDIELVESAPGLEPSALDRSVTSYIVEAESSSDDDGA